MLCYIVLSYCCQMLECEEIVQQHNAHTPNFPQFEDTASKLLQHLLPQMSPLPVCVLSLLPCGAPRAAEHSSSSGSGGRVERPPCSPVTQHSREQPASQADQGQGTAELGDPVGTCPEHRPRPGPEPLLNVFPPSTPQNLHP